MTFDDMISESVQTHSTYCYRDGDTYAQVFEFGTERYVIARWTWDEHDDPLLAAAMFQGGLLAAFALQLRNAAVAANLTSLGQLAERTVR